MISISINEEHLKFVESKAPSLDIGGFSNLKKQDLNKASRLDFQFSGLFGELAWYLHRDGNYDRFKAVLDYKFNTCRKKNIGDSGFDDSITNNGKTRLVDIKSTHVEDTARIKYLNLVIPPREFHQNMIYVCAFTVGKDRRNIDRVILSGWEINECITDKWKYDNSKLCVPTSKLRPMEELEQYIR